MTSYQKKLRKQKSRKKKKEQQQAASSNTDKQKNVLELLIEEEKQKKNLKNALSTSSHKNGKETISEISMNASTHAKRGGKNQSRIEKSLMNLLENDASDNSFSDESFDTFEDEGADGGDGLMPSGHNSFTYTNKSKVCSKEESDSYGFDSSSTNISTDISSGGNDNNNGNGYFAPTAGIENKQTNAHDLSFSMMEGSDATLDSYANANAKKVDLIDTLLEEGVQQDITKKQQEQYVKEDPIRRYMTTLKDDDDDDDDADDSDNKSIDAHDDEGSRQSLSFSNTNSVSSSMGGRSRRSSFFGLGGGINSAMSASGAHNNELLFEKFTKRLEETQDNKKELHPDTFSYMITCKYRSRPFFIALVVTILQVVTSVMLLINLFDDYPPWNANINMEVRVTQFITLAISVLIQDDVQISIEQLGNRYSARRIDEVFKDATMFKWYLGNGARLASGLIVLVATFMLICESALVKDLLMNFTAVSFISAIDDMVFNLGVVGFFHQSTMLESAKILEIEYETRSDWHKLSHYVNQLLLFLVLVIFVLFWYFLVVKPQVDGDYICDQLYVSIGSSVIAGLSSHSGIYDVGTEIGFSINTRKLYTERRESGAQVFDSDITDYTAVTGQLGYCQESSKWAFFTYPTENACESNITSNNELDQYSYDIRSTIKSPWEYVEDTVQTQLEGYHIFCAAEKKEESTCTGDGCECNTGTFGLDCKKSKLCPSFLVETGESSFTYTLLNVIDSKYSVQSYQNPIYATVRTDHAKLIIFSGTRWIFTDSTYFEGLQQNFTTEYLAEYFQANTFHSSNLPKPAVEFISDSVLIQKSSTPLGRKWFFPNYKENKIDQIEYGLPMVDESRPNNGVKIICSFCDRITNPCKFEGKCQEDGSCKCENGATGIFCKTPPTGNGICNAFFNKPEFKYDGGDCCGASCTNEVYCGAIPPLANAFDIKLGSSGAGFPTCLDPDMIPVTIDIQSSGAHYLRIKLVCNGIRYLDIPAYALPPDLDAKEIVMVKDGADCDLSFEIVDNYYYIFTTPLRLDVEIQRELKTTKTEAALAVMSNATTVNGEEGIVLVNNIGRKLLAESRGNFIYKEEDVGRVEIVSFVVVKDCIRENIHNYNELIHYDQLVKGISLQWKDATPEGKAIKWLNAEDSVYSTCGERSGIGLNQRHVMAVINYATNQVLEKILWLTDQHECKWAPGVVCNDEQFLIRMELRNSNLEGTIPKEIGYLETLQVFNAGQNDGLKGTLPSSLGDIKDLNALILDLNELTGTIPTQLGSLGQLGRMNFEWNSLEGKIPTEFGGLRNIESLSLAQNDLTGTLPVEIGKLKRLVRLRLGLNNFVGTIPVEFGNLFNLQLFELLGNKLTGSIPSELSKLGKLEKAILEDNQFNGAIPTELGLLSSLGWLSLSENKITGTFPAELSKLSALGTLNFESNMLSGSIPVEIGGLKNIRIIILRNNTLTGTLPSEIGNLSHLAELRLDENQIEGKLISELGRLGNLRQIELGMNKLSGPIPSEIGNMNNLEIVRMPENQITGTIPDEMFGLSRIVEISLDYNFVNGTISSLIGQFSNLRVIGMRDNALSGTIPSEIGHLIALKAVNLVVNTLVGALPTELGLLFRLENLSLTKNQISGTLPSEMVNLLQLDAIGLDDNFLQGSIATEFGLLTKLDALVISKNYLSGTIPSELGNLVNLNNLRLKQNRLTGTIPSQFGRLTNLDTLSLGINGISGTIPPEFGDMTKLSKVNLGQNRLTGSIPTEMGRLSLLTVLHMFVNGLTGEIPSEFGNLVNLGDLKLLINQLTGEIPSEVGNLKNLKTMDLWQNQLTGIVPAQMGDLSNLATLTLHNNLISGIDEGACKGSMMDRLIVDCQYNCPNECDCRAMDQYGRHYSCPTQNMTLGCKDNFLDFHVIIVPDGAPQETSWDLKDIKGDVLAQGTSDDLHSCVPQKDCMIFTMRDAAGDGMCCNKGTGSYTIFLFGQLYYYGAMFMGEESIPIGQCQ